MASLNLSTGPTIESRLASSQGRRDEAPNIELAEEIAGAGDAGGVQAVAKCLASGSAAIQSDAIKVLYEIGERKPLLIEPHTALFTECLRSRNNRLLWGSLTALACIATVAPRKIADHLDVILGAADRGSVIAKDQAMNILISLKADQELSRRCVALMLERLETAAVNQLPMYAERMYPVLDEADHEAFRAVLVQRLEDHMVASKRKRIEKIIRQLGRR